MPTLSTALRTWQFARGLRRLVRRPVSVSEACDLVQRELSDRPAAFLETLEARIWPHADHPNRLLMEAAGIEPGDVRRLVTERGLTGALEALRDAGVYVTYEEYHGRVPATRGSASFTFAPDHFFNRSIKADYLATTGGSRSAGTPVELSFAYQRRQAITRALQFDLYGVVGAPTATWLPVFPSAAGFGAVMKLAGAGNPPERWFSQIPSVVEGVERHKQLTNRFLPALNALARTGLPSPEHRPTSDPGPVVEWMVDARRRAGRAVMTGYASSITAAARYAIEQGIDLSGVVVFPSSEPVTEAKLSTIRASGLTACPTYAFVPEGIIAMGCANATDEDYHLWGHELAVITRPRTTDSGREVDALLLTSLPAVAPRVMVNVENDDYADVRRDGLDCGCGLATIGLETRLSRIRGLSKVVAAGISVEGRTFDRLVDEDLPAKIGGGPGDYQFVEQEDDRGTVVAIRVHPSLGEIDEARVRDVVSEGLRSSETGVLADEVWKLGGRLVVERKAPMSTKAGKTLAFERLGTAPTGAETER